MKNMVEENKSKFNIISVKELLSLKRGSIDWLVEGVIPLHGITMISGDPASYKTYFLLEVVKAIATESLLLDNFKTTKANILIIDEENYIGLLSSRCRQLGFTEDLGVYFLIKSGFKADKEDNLEVILNFIKEKNIGVVCFDSLVRIHNGEENSAGEMSLLFNNYLSKITQAGASIIFTHHNRKSRDFDSGRGVARGSSDIMAVVDCNISMTKKKEGILVSCGKMRQAEDFKSMLLKVENIDNNVKFSLGEYNDTSKISIAKDLILKILLDKKEYLSREEIKRGIKEDIGDNAIGNALNMLIKDNKIFYTVKEHGKKLYIINTDNNDKSTMD